MFLRLDRPVTGPLLTHTGERMAHIRVQGLALAESPGWVPLCTKSAVLGGGAYHTSHTPPWAWLSTLAP